MSAYWMDSGSGSVGMGRFTASFFLGPGITLPSEHRFESGTQVLVTHLDPLKEVPRRGNVVGCTETQLRIAFQEKFNLDDGEPWRLDVTSSNLSYQRMKTAVQSLNYDPAKQLSQSVNVSHSPSALSPTVSEPSDREVILQGSYLRDVLLRGFRSSTSPAPVASHGPRPNMFTPNAHLTSWARRYANANPVVIPGDPDLKSHGLNDTQIRAVAVMLGGMAGPVPDTSSPSEEHTSDGALSDDRDHAAALQDGERRMALVLGPPGTGKTKTIIEAVRLLKQHFAVPYPVLLCTYTNVAVDNLVEGLVRETSYIELPGRAKPTTLKPLRVGSQGKVRPALEPYTLEAQLATHPRASYFKKTQDELTALVKKRKELRIKIKETRSTLGGAAPPAHAHDAHGQGVAGARTGARAKGLLGRLEAMELDMKALTQQELALRRKMYAIWLEMSADVVRNADVVCTTCITSASAALNVIDFPLVFIDEASMSTEPASLIPLMKGSQHVALIGDHKQLPPVITSPEAQAAGLGVSLFERLSEENFLPSVMLDIQYRMHPTISRFPSREFYDRELRDGTVDASGRVVPGLVPPESRIYPELLAASAAPPVSISSAASALGLDTDIRRLGTEGRPSVVFLDHVGNETVKDRSRVNWTEGHIVCSLVEDLLLRNPGLSGSQIGVIAPYVAQITLLTRLLTMDKNYAARFTAVLGAQRAAEVAGVEVKTVDGFEGREKEIIVFSTVRNNASGHIGFLADRRRLNVGLTRAKRGLFVVGSISTLRIGKGRVSAQAAAAEAIEDLRVSGEEDEEAAEAVAVPESAPAETATDEAPPAKRKRKAAKASKSSQAWQNYTTFLQQEQLIVKLTGARLHRLLWGNVEEIVGPRDAHPLEQQNY